MKNWLLALTVLSYEAGKWDLHFTTYKKTGIIASLCQAVAQKKLLLLFSVTLDADMPT